MVISQKVKDEGKLKKISLYIGFVTREKGRMCYFRPDNLSICRTEKHLCVSVRTPLRFNQNTSVFAVKCKDVSSQTPRRSENIRNYISPERFKAFFCTPKRVRPHAEAFGGACRNIFPDTQSKFKSFLSQIASNKSNFNNFKELL